MFDLSFSCAERVLREVEGSERDQLMLRLGNEWSVKGSYWYPISGINEEKRPVHTEAFQAKYFEQELTHNTLRQIFATRGITTLFEMRENGEMAEIELIQLHPFYTGLEGFWFTEKLDWLIYASHESSVTVGGPWLLSAVQAAWPKWENRIYKTPFYK